MESIKKFEDYIKNIHQVDLEQEISHDIPKFGEYRKGAEKFGGLLTKMMEWLRLQREKSKTELKTITIPIETFTTESHIKLVELENFIRDKIAKGLYNFEIKIDYPNENIIFNDLVKRDNHLLSED